MSYGGSLSCGFDLINSDGSEAIHKKDNWKCGNCKYFISNIHHNSRCELSIREGVSELRDGRAYACERWQEKK